MANKFADIITYFENSLRGIAKINGKDVKAFPHAAGSVFISRIVSLLKTVVNDKNIYSKLDSSIVKERVYRNGKAVVTMMVTDETVQEENMLLVFESFQNVSIDSYLGMKQEGRYGTLQKELQHFEDEEEPQEKISYD